MTTERRNIFALPFLAAVSALVIRIALLRAGGGNDRRSHKVVVLAVFIVLLVVAEVDTALVDKQNLRVVKMRIIPLTGVALIPNFGKPYI